VSPAPILLVDPDEQDRVVLMGILNGLGYPVVDCADADAAFASIAIRPPAVVITAYPMPMNSGADFLAAVRQVAPQAVVIGIVRRGMREVARDALTYGCREFLSKPVDPQLLASHLSAVLATPAASSPIQAESVAPPPPALPEAEIRPEPPAQIRAEPADAVGADGAHPEITPP